MEKELKRERELQAIRDLLAEGVSPSLICRNVLGIAYPIPGDFLAHFPELEEALRKRNENTRTFRYRLLLDTQSRPRIEGKEMLVASTPEQIWQSSFISEYFATFGDNPDRYEQDYLKAIKSNKFYPLSNLYSIAYCRKSETGRFTLADYGKSTLT